MHIYLHIYMHICIHMHIYMHMHIILYAYDAQKMLLSTFPGHAHSKGTGSDLLAGSGLRRAAGGMGLHGGGELLREIPRGFLMLIDSVFNFALVTMFHFYSNYLSSYLNETLAH